MPPYLQESYALLYDYFIVSEFTAYHKCYIDMQFVSSISLLSPGSSDSEFALSSLWDAEKEFAAKVQIIVNSVFCQTQ